MGGDAFRSIMLLIVSAALIMCSFTRKELKHEVAALNSHPEVRFRSACEKLGGSVETSNMDLENITLVCKTK